MLGLRRPEELIEGLREWEALAVGGDESLREDILVLPAMTIHGVVQYTRMDVRSLCAQDRRVR